MAMRGERWKLVLGCDDSERARRALAWAGRFVQENGATLHVVHAVSSVGEWELAAAQIDPDPLRHEQERLLREEWTASLRDAGVPYRADTAVGDPADVIIEAAKRDAADLIVVGASHRGTFGEILHGSVAHKLVHESPIPVAVVP